MTFPSRGCRTCKQRHIKVEEDRGLIFLNENEYAIGQRKRPRGPNLKATSIAQDQPNSATSSKADNVKALQEDALTAKRLLSNPLGFAIAPALDAPLEDYALTYYSRCYIEMPHGMPEMVDGHILQVKCALNSIFFSEPQSVLGLAISAVSHATFGRAQRSRSAVATGCTVYQQKYAKALAKTNMALKDASEALDDRVLLAVMLLSFYENTVMNQTSHISNRDIRREASRSFAHHDGAMAMLKLRRQRPQCSSSGMELDKLVRRQLTRSLLLRSLPLPPWLRDGSKYGEHGLALELDRCMVIVAKLRHQASNLCIGSPCLSRSDEHNNKLQCLELLGEARALDAALVIWENSVPVKDRFRTCTIQNGGRAENCNRIYNGTVHIYPTVGHAGMWNRYRAYRLAVNDTMLKVLSILVGHPGAEVRLLTEAVKSRTDSLADDFCASVPYILGLFHNYQMTGLDVAIITGDPASSEITVTASTAAFLCWPLTMVIMLPGLSMKHQRYLRDRLLELSEIVDDGLLERIANGVPPVPYGAENIP
ncbi:MAG: hypothetical protein Q9195_002464 [Heterodermia aff. obscurata]